jgi:hypothetical protein
MFVVRLKEIFEVYAAVILRKKICLLRMAFGGS